ncbi:MAG TPA: isochorismatase family protein [Roseiflexaceae bacterium]|nr:isochorismatase family protein [Roseiflexaceae bacterium]
MTAEQKTAKRADIQRALINVDDSMLIVIDVQPPFLAKLPHDEGQLLRDRICWLIGVASWLRVPVVVTAEDIAREGGVDAQIVRALPAGVHVYDKMVFDLAAVPIIMAAVAQTGRRSAILVGLETDVCVAHSALGLLARGYHVAVVADATGSPGTAHAYGLQRAAGAGALVTNVKSLFYEWIRTVERARQFRAESARTLPTPNGVRL